nr:hypothetical protein Itr_chr02CG18820 [Ipomoea trifida]GME11555.1 hypothetical protein Iba_scaffold11887CG0010 [Ipomoea batatas]
MASAGKVLCLSFIIILMMLAVTAINARDITGVEWANNVVAPEVPPPQNKEECASRCKNMLCRSSVANTRDCQTGCERRCHIFATRKLH